MFEQVSLYLTSIVLGVMLFFSFVVAPVTFTSLNEENARKFIRKIFPYYYTVNLFISLLILSIFIILQKVFDNKLPSLLLSKLDNNKEKLC